MLLIPCPFCGDRAETEFRHGGEAHIPRPLHPASLSDAGWADYLYNRANPKGLHIERWRHVHGRGRSFNAVRDTISAFFLTTSNLDDPRPDLGAFAGGQRR